MHSTHHNRLRFLKLGLCLEKRIIIYKKGRGGGKAFKITKSDLVTAPNIHTS